MHFPESDSFDNGFGILAVVYLRVEDHAVAPEGYLESESKLRRWYWLWRRLGAMLGGHRDSEGVHSA